MDMPELSWVAFRAYEYL